MELALTTLLLLPGVVSLGIASAPRCRAIAPRDLPTVLVATLGFALIDISIAIAMCKLTPGWGAPKLGASVAALVGGDAPGITRAEVLTSLLELRWQNVLALLYLALASFLTGRAGAWLYDRLLQILARAERLTFDIPDNRTPFWRRFDKALDSLGVTHLVIARGASFWLVIRQAAKLRGEKVPEVYADVTQGDGETLYAGRVSQVICDRSGEPLSIVLKATKRYRRAVYTDPDADGKRREVREAKWTAILDTEAFFMRGENVHNISYRYFGDHARGGYSRQRTEEGQAVWMPATLIAELKRIAQQAPAKGED